MAENVVNYNELILKNYQKTYPNLVEFSYDVLNDAIVYEGNFIKLNGYGLSRINPVFFNLNPEDIFIYLKNGFYYTNDKNAQIKEYFSQLIITEDEEEIMEKYVKQYLDKLNIYARNAQFFDNYIKDESVKEFMQDLMATKKIIEDARKVADANVYNAYQMIANAYDNEMASRNQEISNSNTNDLTLSRTKPGFSGYNEFNKNFDYLNELNKKDSLSMAGFTSIILVIISAISAGMFLAIKLLG